MLTTIMAMAGAATGAAAPAPALHYAFSLHVDLLAPIEQGSVDGRRRRFVPIAGGTIQGPRLSGTVLAGGGDWQAIAADGLTEVNARYALKLSDGTVVDVVNPGVRVATPEVIERLTRGEEVAPNLYYFRTTPPFTVAAGPHGWLRRAVVVARGIRRPAQVFIDLSAVD